MDPAYRGFGVVGVGLGKRRACHTRTQGRLGLDPLPPWVSVALAELAAALLSGWSPPAARPATETRRGRDNENNTTSSLQLVAVPEAGGALRLACSRSGWESA